MGINGNDSYSKLQGFTFSVSWFRCGLAGWGNLHAVSAQCVGAFDRRAGAHDHAYHVHADVEFHLANIHRTCSAAAS